MFRKREDEQDRKARDTAGASDPSMSGMTREMKRMMAKRERAADRLQRPPVARRKERTKPLTFIKEVRGELARVAWPTRHEVFIYTIVVIVSVAFFVTIIFGMDYAFSKGVLWLFGRGG